MRLTYAITIEDAGRAALTVGYEPDAVAHSGRPIVLTLETDDSTTYLSHEQYDVIADLVFAHRPDPTAAASEDEHHIPEVVYDICEHAGQYGRCVLSRVYRDHPRHINAGGRDADTGQAL